jgi:hypothetical protein
MKTTSMTSPTATARKKLFSMAHLFVFGGSAGGGWRPQIGPELGTRDTEKPFLEQYRSDSNISITVILFINSLIRCAKPCG